MNRVFARAAALGFFAMVLYSASRQALVIDSGSTNRLGVTVRLDEKGNATVEQRNTEARTIKLSGELAAQLMRDIKAAGTLSALPAQHCMKSVSFGSRIYIEFNGDRSPDISCEAQQDPHAAALQKDAREVLDAVQSQLGIRRVRPVRPVKPINQE